MSVLLADVRNSTARYLNDIKYPGVSSVEIAGRLQGLEIPWDDAQTEAAKSPRVGGGCLAPDVSILHAHASAARSRTWRSRPHAKRCPRAVRSRRRSWAYDAISRGRMGV